MIRNLLSAIHPTKWEQCEKYCEKKEIDLISNVVIIYISQQWLPEYINNWRWLLISDDTLKLFVIACWSRQHRWSAERLPSPRCVPSLWHLPDNTMTHSLAAPSNTCKHPAITRSFLFGYSGITQVNPPKGFVGKPRACNRIKIVWMCSNILNLGVPQQIFLMDYGG